MPDLNKKGVVLFIVIGVVMVVAWLSIVTLRIISSQSRLTHHQLSRIRAYYADKAGMNLAFDQLRTGAWTQHSTAIKYYCINGKVDPEAACTLPIFSDTLLPNVQIKIYPKNLPGIDGTAKIEIKTDFTDTP
jgi:Tfp pilus assembly protein PilX